MNELQQKAFDLAISGNNVFLSGAAGVGKSYVLSRIIKRLRDDGKRIGITSSTGISAVLIGGRTIHSFLGIGIGNGSAESLAYKVMTRNRIVYQKLRRLDVIIIDEISMIDSEMFDKISNFLKIVRNDNRAFGGLEIIISGDFCQLKSVVGDLYAFQSAEWAAANLEMIELTELMRQSSDYKFQEMLHELRWGYVSKKTARRLRRLMHNNFDGDIKPTRLYSKNVDVDAINKHEYETIKSRGAVTHEYITRYSDHSYSKSWGDLSRIPQSVELCEGAQVMLTWNIDQDRGLINGTRGIIILISEKNVKIKLIDGNIVDINYVTIKSEDDPTISLDFIPVRLAYAVTIHRSQGSTLDCVELSLSNIWENGQAYTALSRARNLKSIHLLNLDLNSFRCHPEVLKFYGKNI